MGANANPGNTPLSLAGLRAVWWRITRPAPQLTDVSLRRQAQLLSSLLVILVSANLASLGICVWTGAWSECPRVLGTAIVTIVLYSTSRSIHYRFSASLTVLASTALAYVLSYSQHDVYANLLPVYLIFPILLSSMLLSIQFTVMLVLADVIGLIVYDQIFDLHLVADNWLIYLVAMSALILLSMRHAAALESDRRAQLEQKEQRYRLLVESAPVPMALSNASTIVFTNSAAAALLGARSPDELAGRSFVEFVHPDDRMIIEPLVQRMQAGDVKSVSLELRLVRLDGSVLQAAISAQRFKDGTGPAVQILAVDITAQRQARMLLEENEERFRLLAHVSNDALYDNNLQSQLAWRQNGQHQLLDKRTHDPDWWTNHIHPDDRAATIVSFERALADPSQYRWQHRYRLWLQDGGYAHVVDRATIVRDEAGRAVRVIGAVTDVTAQEQAKQAEQEQRNLAEALFDISTVINSMLDIDQILTAILHATERLVPFDAASITLFDGDGEIHVAYQHNHHPNVDVSAPARQFPAGMLSAIQQSVTTQQLLIIGDTLTSPAWPGVPGSEWIRAYVVLPIFTGEGTVGYLHLASQQPQQFTDVHIRRLTVLVPQVALAISNAQLYQAAREYAGRLEQRVEERTNELRRTTERVETILNNSSEAILLANPAGRIQQTNEAFDTLMLSKPDALFNHPLTVLVAPESAPAVQAYLESTQDGERSTRLEVIAQRNDGTRFIAEMGLSAVRNNEVVSGIVGTLRDITVYREAERNLRHALEKERELGELKSRFVIMASHEFRTPLATIQSTADTLRYYGHRLSEDQHDRSYDKIENQILRITEMLDDILPAGKLREGQMDVRREEVDLAAFVTEVVADYQENITTHAITVTGEEDGCSGRIDPALLRQAIINLLANATRYSKAGRPVTVRYDCQNGDFQVAVIDQGIGIPKQDQTHIFELFHRGMNVTTYPGTGLGLTIVQQAIELHGGTITVDSVEHVGTTVQITLPLAAKS